MKPLDQIFLKNIHKSTTKTVPEIVKDSTKEWLALFRDYLPSADASEHARGAHDAVNDLENWLTFVDEKRDSNGT